MSSVILLLSGPNLNLLGNREPEHYGTETLEHHVRTATEAAATHGFELEHLQSNHEGVLIDAVHAARATTAGIVVNAASFTHSSWGLHDALAAYVGPIVELHLSNPDSREPWRRTSVIAPVATGCISGFKGAGYRLAVEAIVGEIRGRRS